MQAKKKYALLIASLYFLISVYLLTLPGSEFPQVSWFDKIPMFDKWVHIGLFGILVFLWCRVVRFEKRIFLTVAICCLAYGILIEFVQHFFIPYRGFELWDIVADAIGCMLGYIIAQRFLLKKNN
jgi:VanZ family protein